MPEFCAILQININLVLAQALTEWLSETGKMHA